MKMTKIIALTLLILMVAVVACKESFLDVAPTGALQEEQLTSPAGLEVSLIAAYSMLLGRSGNYSDASNWFWGSVLGGDANKGSNAGDQSQMNEVQNYVTQTNNISVLQKYTATYEGVARSNLTIRLVQNADPVVTEEAKTRIAAEARFLRGHYYFDLKKNFGDVPYVDDTWDEVTPVSNNVDIWPFIEADFQAAFDNLPEEQVDIGRANKWAAGAYLAKTYLFQGKFAEAKAMFDQVIEQGVNSDGVKYDLVENYANVFRSTNDNNEETVFASQAASGTGSTQNANPGMVLNFPHGTAGPPRPGGCCGFFQPSFELANSFRTGADGLPLLDNSYNDPANALVTDMGLQSGDPFTPDTGNLDPRIDHSIGRRGIPYLDWGPHPGFDWIRDQPYAGPYSPKKFIYYLEGEGTENDASSWTPGYTAVNYNIIRFADVLLMAAEAEIEEGTLDKALEYINRVRVRADSSRLKDDDGDVANYEISVYDPFTSQEEARTAVRFERKLELSGEGHRFYDLVRWGIATNVLNAYLDHEDQFLTSPFSGANFITNRSEVLPIPQDEIDLLGQDVLIQNPGF